MEMAHVWNQVDLFLINYSVFVGILVSIRYHNMNEKVPFKRINFTLIFLPSLHLPKKNLYHLMSTFIPISI